MMFRPRLAAVAAMTTMTAGTILFTSLSASARPGPGDATGASARADGKPVCTIRVTDVHQEAPGEWSMDGFSTITVEGERVTSTLGVSHYEKPTDRLIQSIYQSHGASMCVGSLVDAMPMSDRFDISMTVRYIPFKGR